jgi:hypothetical protein
MDDFGLNEEIYPKNKTNAQFEGFESMVEYFTFVIPVPD